MSQCHDVLINYFDEADKEKAAEKRGDSSKSAGEEREILRKQMLLLAERSKECTAGELVDLTNAMISICDFLSDRERVAGFRLQKEDTR